MSLSIPSFSFSFPAFVCFGCPFENLLGCFALSLSLCVRARVRATPLVVFREKGSGAGGGSKGEAETKEGVENGENERHLICFRLKGREIER